MPVFPKDDDLCIWVGIKLLFYPPLQLQHHRASGVNYLDILPFGDFVCHGRLAMCPEHDLDIVQAQEVVMVDGDQPHFPEPVTLHAVVYDVAQTV